MTQYRLVLSGEPTWVPLEIKKSCYMWGHLQLLIFQGSPRVELVQPASRDLRPTWPKWERRWICGVASEQSPSSSSEFHLRQERRPSLHNGESFFWVLFPQNLFSGSCPITYWFSSFNSSLPSVNLKVEQKWENLLDLRRLHLLIGHSLCLTRGAVNYPRK